MTSDDFRRLLRNDEFVGTPPGNPGRAGQIERRIARRRHHMRAQVALVAAAVLAVAGLSTVATRGSSDRGEPAISRSDTPSPLPKVKLPRAVPIEKLWPQAATKIPSRLPNGRKYFPETFVDDHTLLVTTWSSFEKTDAVWRYDTETRRLSPVAQVITPPKASTFASDFAVGDGRVAWWTAREENGGTIVEIWSAPLSGGETQRVASMPVGKNEGGIDRLVIAGGKVIWSRSTFSPGARGGVFAVPLTGGEPTKIVGTDHYHIVDWPWIGTPDGRTNGSNIVAFEELRNVETGERRTARVGPGRWTCDLTWCMGSTDRGAALVRRDGSDGRQLPRSWAAIIDQFALDRFVIVPGSKSRSMELYDLRSERLADLGPSRVPNTFRTVQPGDRLYWMDQSDGYLVVDLTAIR
jgi:hypothetical protein